MRDQLVGNDSDGRKFAFLRALAGDDRSLGIAWYYAPGDNGCVDNRGLEWLNEPAWHRLDPELHAGLAGLSERSVDALERAAIWPENVLFFREPMPARGQRIAWGNRMRSALNSADIVFLDPDVGLGAEDAKHATLSEIQRLQRPGRAIVFITFPGRKLPHDTLVQRLHKQICFEANAETVVTLRTNVSVPRAEGSRFYVQRQCWFTVVEPDTTLIDRVRDFRDALASVPRVSARLDGAA